MCIINWAIDKIEIFLKTCFFLQDPYDAAKRSVYAGFQHSPVTSSFLAFSNENFHSGKSVPSLSRNSSDASSQYLKSIMFN